MPTDRIHARNSFGEYLCSLSRCAVSRALHMRVSIRSRCFSKWFQRVSAVDVLSDLGTSGSLEPHTSRSWSASFGVSAGSVFRIFLTPSMTQGWM